jgi:hypothetical protein
MARLPLVRLLNQQQDLVEALALAAALALEALALEALALEALAQAALAQAALAQAALALEALAISCLPALLRLPCTARLPLAGLHLALPLTSTQQDTPCLDAICSLTCLAHSLFGVELDVTPPQLEACTIFLHLPATPLHLRDLIPTLTYLLAAPTMNWLALFLVKLLLQLQD